MNDSTLQVQGIDLHISGEGPQTIVMIHGWPDTWRLWDATVATQRLIPLAPFGGLDARGFARFTNGVLRVQRRLRLP